MNKKNVIPLIIAGGLLTGSVITIAESKKIIEHESAKPSPDANLIKHCKRVEYAGYGLALLFPMTITEIKL